MSTKRMLARTPSAQLIGRAKLEDYELRFHKRSNDGSGKADVVLEESSHVWGALYEVPIEEKLDLDKHEALGKGYEEKEVIVDLESGNTIPAKIYYATRIDASLAPYTWYLRHVIEGAKEHNLPADYIERLEAIRAKRDPDSSREIRELKIYG